MTTFTLTIETEGEAFEDGPEHELARMLGVTANRLLCGYLAGTVVDVNGNVRGHYGLEAEPTEAPAEPDGTEPWGDLLARLPDGVAETDRFRVVLHGTRVTVGERGNDDIYWPLGEFAATITRAGLTSRLALDAYQATLDVVAAAAVEG